MKKRSEKFDDLPLDFDPEVIWKGVRKPTPIVIYRKITLGLLTVGSILLIFWFVFPRKKKNLLKEEGFSSRVKTDASAIVIETPNYLDHKIQTEISALSEKDGSVSSLPSSKALGSCLTSEKNALSLNFQKRDAISALDLRHRSFVANGLNLSNYLMLIPDKLSPLKEDKPKKMSLHPLPSIIHTLNIYAAAGTHQNQFISSGLLNRQSTLERAQLDVQAGLSFGAVLKRNFTLNMGVSYALFKDRIEQGVFKVENQQLLKVDYDLYNHYHLTNAHFELGKRFIKPQVFYDLRIGAAANILQKSELDYFDQYGALVNEELILGAYDDKTPVFFSTYRLGIGRIWNLSVDRKTFGSIGFMGNSPVRLNNKGSEYTHRVIPAFMYAELGWEF